MQRLSPETQHLLDDSVARPRYDPSASGAGIVHLGVGAFHRAHQAVYTDGALAMHGGDWRISGVSLRTRTAADQLNPQGGLYTVASRNDQSCEYRLIAAIDRVIAAAGDASEAIVSMAAPETKIVSLTITEKGYGHSTATGHLAPEHPEIAADLKSPLNPQTAVGCIVAALRQRRDSGRAGITVLSCDNLPNNGAVTRQVVLDFAAAQDEGLSRWIDENATFPATMVDRICPATTAADREAAAQAIGLQDHGLVVAEPFSQWVIEDCFINGRPRWEDVGAQIVADVAPYETAKLRLLNGSHSALAYFGCLEGYEYIHEVIADDDMAAFVRRLMEGELVPTLYIPDGFDVVRYMASLNERFANPALRHRTTQVAMDGSQKLPQRLINTAMERLDGNEGIAAISLAIAAWIRYVTVEDKRGRRNDIDDPLKNELLKLPSSGSNDAADVVNAVLDLSAMFEPRAAASAALKNSLIEALDAIVQRGARGAIKQFLATSR